MRIPKSAKRQTQQEPVKSAEPKDPKSTKRNVWGDVDKDGDFDFDDVLTFLRDGVEFALPRLPMIAYGGLAIVSAGLNIAAWTGVMSGLAAYGAIAGTLTWAVLQSKELDPIWPQLNLKASLAALIRLQRKPLEVPVINHDLTPQATKELRAYRDREKNQSQFDTFLRWMAYGIELFVLCGGQLVSPLGINWGAVLLALIGFTGVEIGIRGFSKEGSKLLSPEEREFHAQILASAARSTVRVDQ
jgi:hypothetical protein